MCDPSCASTASPPAAQPPRNDGLPGDAKAGDDNEARPWYAESFGHEYLDRYPRRDRAEAAAAVGMLASRLPLEERVVLDLACGAGRHIAPLLAQGARRVVGLDLSEALLAVARHDLEPELGAGRVELVPGDMREIPLAQDSVDVVTNFFTSFGYFDSEAQDRRVLAEVARVLRPGGHFMLDFFNAPKVIAELVAEETLVVDGKPHRVERWFDESRRRLEKRVYDAASRVQLRESVRAYEPDELHALTRDVGLSRVEQLGGYDGSVYDPATSPRIIAIFRK